MPVVRWLLCYYFMLSLEIRSLFVVAPREKAPINKMLSCYLCFQLRLNSHRRKLLQEISYKRDLKPQVKVRCFWDWNWILLCFSKVLLTWSPECDQQIRPPLFQTESCFSATRRRTDSKEDKPEPVFVTRFNWREIKKYSLYFHSI